jgi:hypothetical protein
MDIPSLIIGAAIAMLLANAWVWFVLPRWHDRGQRRLQRRTEARLLEMRRSREISASVTQPWTPANGATEPRPRSRKPSATDGNTRGR